MHVLGCGAKGNCPDVCINYPIQNRIRHLNTDVGYYLDFSFGNDGIPQGCSAFDKVEEKAGRNRWAWGYKGDLPDAVAPAGKFTLLKYSFKKPYEM